MSAVAVVGGGIFGCAAAIDLARAGHRVDLYERHDGILRGATRAQQGRLHSGYHYPRSPETIAACRESAERFAARWPQAVRRDHRHHYVISRASRVTAAEYLATLDVYGLPYEHVEHPLVRREAAVACIQVPEVLVDIAALRGLLLGELARGGVRLRLGTVADPAELSGGYDWVVCAGYGRPAPRPLRFEVVETALVRLGPQWASQSMVVVDGPFTSIDPQPGGLHMLYDVHLSVHAANVGAEPSIPDGYESVLDRGPLLCELSQAPGMLAHARMHLTGLDDAEWVGSMWTVRAVLPDVDDTDARPTLVETDGNMVSVLGGKMCTAVNAAARVLEVVNACAPALSR